jgi:hypothetical protein
MKELIIGKRTNKNYGINSKILPILVLLLCIPALGFSQVGIGVAAFAENPILQGTDTQSDVFDGGFSFGVNGRIRFLIFNLDALALYATPTESIDLFLTGQLSLPILPFLRLSAGVGPAIRFYLGDDGPDSPGIDWLNAKADLDIILGRISFGVSFQYLLPNTDASAIDFAQGRGRIGASFILW